MKSAGSSHSNAVMNSWSSIPNEYVVWLWIPGNSSRPIADVLLHRALAVFLGQRVPRPHLHERVDDEVGLVVRRDLPCAAGLRVLRGHRRREIGVRRLEPAGERRPVQLRAELAEVDIALGDLPEEEVAVRADAGARVRTKALHALCPGLDDLGERVLARGALLDRLAPPFRRDAVEAVGDVLAFGHVRNASRSGAAAWRSRGLRRAGVDRRGQADREAVLAGRDPARRERISVRSPARAKALLASVVVCVVAFSSRA